MLRIRVAFLLSISLVALFVPVFTNAQISVAPPVDPQLNAHREATERELESIAVIERKTMMVKDANGHSAAPSQKSQPSVSLNPGQELVAATDIPPVIQPANLQVASAWEGGRLVFNGVSRHGQSASQRRCGIASGWL
jgi:hypothetical protein